MLTIGTKKAACQGEIVDFPKNALHSCSLCLRIAHGSVNKVSFLALLIKIRTPVLHTTARSALHYMIGHHVNKITTQTT